MYAATDQRRVMPRSQVQVRYQRVERRKRPRGHEKPHEAIIYAIRLRSPLARYLHSEADSGLSVHELVEQFQEYDCKHEWGIEPIGVTEQQEIFQCQECGLTKHRLRPGRVK